MNINCQIQLLQESFELNKFCMIDFSSNFFSNAICLQTILISLTFVYFLTIDVLQNRLISFQVPPSNFLII